MTTKVYKPGDVVRVGTYMVKIISEEERKRRMNEWYHNLSEAERQEWQEAMEWLQSQLRLLNDMRV